MRFQHASEIWRDYPELVPGVLVADGVTGAAAVDAQVVAKFSTVAQARLAAGPEASFPEIQAWRQTFSRMGLKPTQYRCASESLLRRFRKDGALPRIHPLIDLCNAISLAFATPVAVFDLARVTGHLEVRYAAGDESYLTFAGETEHPAAGEVIFADGAGRAHARRWTNRQSGYSAVREATSHALIVAEAMHGSAATDIPELISAITDGLQAGWSITPTSAVLTQSAPRFDFSR